MSKHAREPKSFLHVSLASRELNHNLSNLFAFCCNRLRHFLAVLRNDELKHAQALKDVTKIAIGNLNFLILGLYRSPGVLQLIRDANSRLNYKYGKMPKNPHYRSPPPYHRGASRKKFDFFAKRQIGSVYLAKILH